MSAYSDYEEILREYNWTGNGQSGITQALPTTSISPDVNGVYTLSYNFLLDQNSLLLSSYYQTTDNEYVYFRSPTQLQKDTTETILHKNSTYDYSYSAFFDDVANINFTTDTPQNADILIGQRDGVAFPSNTTGGESLNYDPDTQSPDYQPVEKKYGDIWFNEDFVGWDSGQKGDADFWNVLHEFGHSLGLAHPDGALIDNSQKYTMMATGNGSLAPGMDNIIDSFDVYASGLQLYDIAAIQEIYGRNYSTRTGNSIYDILGMSHSGNSDDAFLYTIWDGAGEDTIDARMSTVSAEIDLRQGRFSSIGKDVYGLSLDKDVDASAGDPDPGNVAIAYHTIIENAWGTDQNDIIIGNAWNNILIGEDGDDTLYGDGIVYDGNEGYGANDGNHESGSGIAAATDGSGDDELHGGAGNDILYGGAGNDLLIGGTGFDKYYYNLGDGHDTIVDSDINTLYFDSQISLSNISFSQNGDDFIWNFSDGGTLTVSDYYINTGTSQNYISFGGGSSGYWNQARLTGGVIQGSNSADLITGSNGNDNIDAYNGNDIIFAGNGDDVVTGNNGNDIIYGGAGIDYLFGHYGNDVIFGGAGDDYLLETYGGNDELHGGDGNDYIAYASGNSIIYGDAGNDTLSTFTTDPAGILFHGGLGDDIVTGDQVYGDFYGDAGNDYFQLRHWGEANFYGGADDDHFKMSTALSFTLDNIVYYGGSGDDIYEFSGFSASAATIIIREESGANDVLHMSGYEYLSDFTFNSNTSGDLIVKAVSNPNAQAIIEDYFSNYNFKVETFKTSRTNQEASIDTLLNFSNLGSDNVDDILIGDSQMNTISGYGGDDQLSGLDGDDFLFGGSGNDTITGGNGNDNIAGGSDDDVLDGGAGDDILYGEAGNDTYIYVSGLDTFEESNGEDTIQFGTGVSVYDLTIANSGTDDTLITVTAGTDEILLQDNINADANLHFENLEFDNGLVLDFTDYNNWQWGSSAFERINGDANDNTLLGASGNDRLYGYDGNDQIYGGDGNDKIWGGNGDDYIFGGLGLDTLRGEAGNDTLVGAGDNDTLYGGTGNDILDGGIDSGFDNLWGDAGDDILYATAGNDFLRGGTGSDTFIFDDITDFAGTAASTVKSGFDSNTTGDNDVLDIKDIIDYDSSTDVLSDFVALTDNGSNTTLSVDKDGAGTGHSWTTVAIIQNVTGEWAGAADMLAQNNLIVE